MKTHLSGVKTKAQCGATGLKVKRTGKWEDVTCESCMESSRFKRMENKPSIGGIITTGDV